LVEVVVTMEEEPTTAAAAEEDIPAEEETLPEAEGRPAMAEEETLPATEERPAQEQNADPAAAPQSFQVPTWNLDERIPIAPQEWDADTPQIGVRAAEDGVEIIELEDSDPRPEPPCISPTKPRSR
jgi:pyruvate/2-oxoglutarate dehydrogenase complex dihydrolipoamide acyltransferase (E2) component